MKTFLLGLALLSAATALTCYQGADSANAVSTECPDHSTTSCNGPAAIVDYVPVVDDGYSCGECAPHDADTCLACDTGDDCNIPVAEQYTEYECSFYEWDTDGISDAWKVQENYAVTCAILKDGALEAVCNMPGAKAVEGTTPTGNPQFCGPCADDDVTNELCALVEYTEYECSTYAWDTDAWKVQDAKATCTVLKGEKEECNKPGAKAVEGTTPTGNPQFCGPCADEAVTSELCANSASTITTLLAVVAIIYNLL